MRHQHKKNRERPEGCGERRAADQRLLGILKILSQVVAIIGTIMAMVDALHRW